MQTNVIEVMSNIAHVIAPSPVKCLAPRSEPSQANRIHRLQPQLTILEVCPLHSITTIDPSFINHLHFSLPFLPRFNSVKPATQHPSWYVDPLEPQSNREDTFTYGSQLASLEPRYTIAFVVFMPKFLVPQDQLHLYALSTPHIALLSSAGLAPPRFHGLSFTMLTMSLQSTARPQSPAVGASTGSSTARTTSPKPPGGPATVMRRKAAADRAEKSANQRPSSTRAAGAGGSSSTMLSKWLFKSGRGNVGGVGGGIKGTKRAYRGLDGLQDSRWRSLRTNNEPRKLC